MTFENEIVREAYHELPTQTQFEYCELEIYLNRQGKMIHVQEVFRGEDRELKVLIRIDEKSVVSVSV